MVVMGKQGKMDLAVTEGGVEKRRCWKRERWLQCDSCQNNAIRLILNICSMILWLSQTDSNKPQRGRQGFFSTLLVL